MGGLARGQESHTLVQEFDFATNMWRDRASMFSDRLVTFTLP